MIRWLKRIAVGAFALVLVLVVAGAVYERLARRSASRDYPAPGKLVDVGGGRKIQIDCRGTGTPLVVFEAGLDGYGSLSWSAVQDEVARFTRTCAYSRAGVMWSDPSNRPFSAANVAEDLHHALATAGEKPPFVMVGHSLGGPYITVFTARYGSDVAGLVFVDASHPDQLARIQAATGKDLSHDSQVSLAASLSWSGVIRLITAHNALPPGAPAAMVAPSRAWFPQSLPAMNAEMNGLAATLAEAGKAHNFGNRPFFVLTHGESFPLAQLKAQGIDESGGRRLDVTWRDLQNDEATWSSRSHHEVVAGAQHYIQFGKPKVVIAAIHEIVDEVRAQQK